MTLDQLTKANELKAKLGRFANLQTLMDQIISGERKIIGITTYKSGSGNDSFYLDSTISPEILQAVGALIVTNFRHEKEETEKEFSSL